MPTEAAGTLSERPSAPALARLVWKEPSGNQGGGQIYWPTEHARRLAAYYKKEVPARQVWIEFHDGAREECKGE